VKSARAKFNAALTEVENKTEEANNILDIQSTIKSLSIDIIGTGPQLDVFRKVHEIVKLDSAKFGQGLTAVAEGKVSKPLTV
jgi:hypothetical protein